MWHKIEDRKTELVNLCKKFQVVKLSVFGSATTGSFTEESDVDLLISFEEGLDPLIMGQNYWDMIDALEQLFGREIDLVIESSLKNKYFIEEVNETKQLLYVAA